MTSRERMICALERRRPDRLPVTTHHLMDSFLKRQLRGASAREFFDQFGLDAIHWVVAHRPDEAAGEFFDPLQGVPGFLEARRISTDRWRVYADAISGQEWPTTRYRFATPKGELTMVVQSNEHTAWVREHPIKEKRDIGLLGAFMTAPKCGVEAVNHEAREFGERGLVRGHVCCFDVFGNRGRGRMPRASSESNGSSWRRTTTRNGCMSCCACSSTASLFTPTPCEGRPSISSSLAAGTPLRP